MVSEGYPGEVCKAYRWLRYNRNEVANYGKKGGTAVYSVPVVYQQGLFYFYPLELGRRNKYEDKRNKESILRIFSEEKS